MDGSSHTDRETADRLRDDVLRARGNEVLRFSVQEVNDDIERVVSEVRQAAMRRSPLRRLRTGPDAAELDLDWYLYRYGIRGGPETDNRALPASTQPKSKQPRGKLGSAGERTPGASKRAVSSQPMSKFRCLDCERDFVAPIQPSPTCRTDRAHTVRGVCRECGRELAFQPPLCATCRDSWDVGLENAGRGARSPSGALPQARRGRRWKGR